MKTIFGLLLLSASAFGQLISPAQTQHVYVPADNPNAPFSNAVMVNDNEIYIAGHIGLDPKTGKPPVKVEDEARAVMDDRRPRKRAGLLLRPCYLRRVQRRLSHILQREASGAGIHRGEQVVVQRALRGTGDRHQATPLKTEMAG
jgi:hypothetical protein